MRMLLLAISLLMTALPAYAYDVIERETNLTQAIDLEPYDVNPLEVKKSILDVLIRNNWIITDHGKNQIIAIYDGKAKVKVSISEQQILLSEIPSTVNFRERWMRSLHSYIEKNLLYYHQVRLANKLL
ncbi:MAG: hypothetical protein ABW068_13870 [Candidatus Thiodiazotropha sp.]